MFQYLFARKLQAELQDIELVNYAMPEWGYTHANRDVSDHDRFIWIEDDPAFELNSLAGALAEHRFALVKLHGFFQDLDLLPPVAVARTIFPASDKFAGRFGDDDLVINIRAGDIVDEPYWAWYPLIPIDFYRQLVAHCGKRPIFVGQLAPNLYVDALRAAFPEAEFISSDHFMDDFELVRSARHLCIAASTFSWFAGWLSNATRIYYPMVGFLNPALRYAFGTDLSRIVLTPFEDPRYRFCWLPFYRNDYLPRQMRVHQEIATRWKFVAAADVKFMVENFPFSRSKDQFQPLTDELGFVGEWYLRAHPDARDEISSGWYRSAEHHYRSLGKLRGFPPRSIGTPSASPLISAGCRTNQSSSSAFSVGSNPVQDSARVVNGLLGQVYGNHTDQEDFPWLELDLGRVFQIDHIKIFNRADMRLWYERLFPLVLQAGTDAADEVDIVRVTIDDHPWQSDTAAIPLELSFSPPLEARFLKLRIDSLDTILHVVQVQVFGQP